MATKYLRSVVRVPFPLSKSSIQLLYSTLRYTPNITSNQMDSFTTFITSFISPAQSQPQAESKNPLDFVDYSISQSEEDWEIPIESDSSGNGGSLCVIA
jgi:hypothetical protein